MKLALLTLLVPLAAVPAVTRPVEGQVRTPAAAPAPAPARVWYEVTVGGAGAKLTCDLCTPTRDVGASAALAAGAYASPTLRVGIEISRWTYSEDDVREHLDGVGLVAHLTPDPTKRVFLLGGLGWTSYRAGDFSWSAPRVSVGVGYDLPAFGRWVVGNVIALDGAAFGSLRSEGGTVVRNVGLSSVRVGVQLRRR